MLSLCYDSGTDTKRMKLSEPDSDEVSINELNDDCFLEIFSYLEIADIKQVEKVCTRWKGLCYDSWKVVEGLECHGSTWYLLGNQPDHRLYELTCMNDLKESLKNCGQYITYFRLSCRRPIDSAIFTILLRTVPQFCKNLRDVEIDSVHSPAAMEIRSMANSCMNLERIIFIRIDQALEKELGELLRRNRKLTYFKLGGDYDFNRMSGDFLRNISAETIEQLHIERCYNLKQHHFKTAIRTFKQLKLLDISYCSRITNDGIAALAALDKLEILKMDSLWKVNDEPIGNLPSTLKFVHCGGCNNIRDSGVIRLIERASNLTRLDLSYCSITNRTIGAAIEVTKRRTNGIILEIDICDTLTNIPAITTSSPFLKLINAQYNFRA